MGKCHEEEIDMFPPPDANNFVHAEVMHDINFESAKARSIKTED